MAKKSIARRHHFLPQAYLAQFTDTGIKKGQFFVLDVETGHRFRTSPKKVAVELDFNRVDIEGIPPDFVENSFAPMEQEAVRAIENTIASGEFPTDEDYSAILHLIGLVAVRNPLLRRLFNRAREQTIRHISEILVSDEKIWNCQIQKARQNGIEIPDSVSFREMKCFIENGKYKLEFHPQDNLRLEMTAFDTVLSLLHERNWSLIIAPSDGPEFICSDHPVTLYFKSGRQGPIGFGLPKTELFFPLTRRMGFYGTFEDPLKKVAHVRPGNVATMNRRIAFNADRHIFSALDSFLIWDDGKIRAVVCGDDRNRTCAF